MVTSNQPLIDFFENQVLHFLTKHILPNTEVFLFVDSLVLDC